MLFVKVEMFGTHTQKKVLCHFRLATLIFFFCRFTRPIPMLSNRPGGARIGPKIPDWMSNNLAGREK